MPTPRSEPATLDSKTRDGWTGWGRGGAGDSREPRIRLLYHSDLDRFGAVSLPGTVQEEQWLAVGRNAPSFTILEQYGEQKPVDDPQVSREQLRLRFRRDDVLFEIEPVASARRPVVHVHLEGDGDRAGIATGAVSPIERTTLLPPGSCIAIGDRVLLGLELAETRPPRADRMGLVGESDVVWALRDEVRSVAQFGRPALVTGPTGAGKELVARALHVHGPRPKRPFVPVNCAALPHALIESVLFGHRKGAFTGADADERGLFRAADGGTLFLDELGELPLTSQPKLLRVLQDGVVVPVGGHDGRRVDVRVVAATHRDVRELVRNGDLREDLYHRISAHPLRVPPLAERRFDIPELFVHALRRLRTQHTSLEWLWTSGQRWRPAVPIAFVAHLLRQAFDGNVRELENIVERTARLNLEEGSFRAPDDPTSTVSSFGGLPPETAHVPAASTLAPPPSDLAVAVRIAAEALGLANKTVLKLLSPDALVALVADPSADVKRRATDALIALLDARDYNQTLVAATLGTSRTTLIKLMDDLGVPRATDLTLGQIAAARAAARDDIEAAARALRVSSSALKRRLAALEAKG